MLACSLLKPAQSGEDGGRGLDELLAGVGLAAIALSFSISGHPASLGAPVVGVSLDMIHLIAASAWMGSMIFLGPLAPHHDHDTLDSWRSAVLQFGALARYCVVAIVITGALQSIRIDGVPLTLVTSAHGRLTLVKILLLSLILWAANINRQRISRRLERHEVTVGIQGALRRAMATELTIGGFVLAVTAALVAVAPAG